MAMNLTEEERAVGQANFNRVVGEYAVTRRDFMKGLLAAGAVLPVSAAAYYGYKKLEGNPVRVGLIGAGDEAGVLVGEHNPDYLNFIAFCDLRPSNHKRIFDGEPTGPRKGFNRIYGKDAKKIKSYDTYKQLLEDKDIEAVVIALPLHLHAPVAIDAMRAGKHVLSEKLMAWNIQQCKEEIKVSDETDRILTVGHQRHYSLLYAHAVEIIQSGILGDIKHIRALWHRNNSWPSMDEEGNVAKDKVTGFPFIRDSWRPAIKEEDRQALEGRIHELGYKTMEELVRWRLYHRTGAGLMAELGSHQMDACSIFLGHVHPVAVSGYGGKLFYKDDREVDDSIFVTFEFPGKNYFSDPEHKVIKDPNDLVVVTYSSINTNSFEPYGECVMGDRGTMVTESEERVLLYPEKNPNKAVAGGVRGLSVTVTSGAGGQPALDTSATTGPATDSKAVETGAGAIAGPVSHGYREEMEHFAHCIRMHQKAGTAEERTKWRLTPRCHGRVAMADAVIALTANLAMKHQTRIKFEPTWFDASSADVPDVENVADPFLGNA